MWAAGMAAIAVAAAATSVPYVAQEVFTLCCASLPRQAQQLKAVIKIPRAKRNNTIYIEAKINFKTIARINNMSTA